MGTCIITCIQLESLLTNVCDETLYELFSTTDGMHALGKSMKDERIFTTTACHHNLIHESAFLSMARICVRIHCFSNTKSAYYAGRYSNAFKLSL